ncbi:hypothetical protein HAX54_015802 [Datura stramonium]|uniref:Uncharacterized protein n=1 Tax=Datura stramonium TaxID=4076 RepID=A0ABS8UJ90_DATST|nr:hypothetical protein [Datura stramonium]
MAQINLPLEEMTKVQRAEAARLAEEARLAEIATSAKAAKFAGALAERHQQTPSSSWTSLSASNKAIADGIAEGSMMAHTFSRILDKMTNTKREWHTRESEATTMSYSREMTAKQ